MRTRPTAPVCVAAWIAVIMLLNACAPAATPAPTARPSDSQPALPVATTPQDSARLPAGSIPAAPADCPARGAFPPLFAGIRAGVNAFLLYTDTERATALIQHADFAWVRQQIHWRDIETSPGSYDWSALDRAIAAAHQASLQVLLSVVASPSWATANRAGGLPDAPAALAGFMRVLAAHYAGIVGAYEIWNEPNLAVENGGTAATPAHYLAVLKAAYPAVKQSDPCALVLAAPLAATATTDPAIAADDLQFYRDLYWLDDRAFLRSADLIAIHPGGGDHPFDARWPDDQPAQSRFYFRHIEEIRAIMQQAGDPRQAWVTEVGWATSAVPGAPPPITPEQQATNLVGAFQLARRQYPWITGMFAWNLNFAVLGTDEKSAFGILAPDWTPRPAYIALQAYLRDQAAQLLLERPAFSAGAPYQVKWAATTEGKVHTPPTLAPDGTLYVGSDMGHFYAIAPAGGLRWVFDAPGSTRNAPALGADGTIFLGDESGQLTALRSDGSVRWKQQLAGGIRGAPQLAGDALYVATAGGTAYRLGLDGAIRWRMPLDGPATAALLGGDQLYIPTEAGSAYAFSTAGAQRWHALIGHKIACAPALVGQRLLIGDADGNLTSLDAQSGRIGWQRHLVDRIVSPSLNPNSPLISGPPLDGTAGRLYLGGRNGTLTALDADGRVQWRYDTGSDITTTPLRAADGDLYVGLYDQRVVAVKPDGTPRWQMSVRGAVRATPQRGPDGTLYVVTIGGVVYALAPQA